MLVMGEKVNRVPGGSFTQRQQEIRRNKVGIQEMSTFSGRITIAQTEEQLRQAEIAKEEAVEKSIEDSLTGLPNRRGFIPQIRGAFARSARRDEPLALIFIDLDEFKFINDTYGHNAGDQVLKKVTALLKNFFREVDQLCRWGGDELLVLLENSDENSAYLRASEFLGRLRKLKIPNGDKFLSITASIGVAPRPAGDTSNVEEFVRQADKEMYLAKQGGKNQVHMHSSTGPNGESPIEQ